MLRYWMGSRAWFRSQLAKENHNKLKRTFWEKSLWQCRWMIRWKWAVTVAMESIFSRILRSEIPILPQCHTHLRNVFLRARFPVRGDVFVSLVNHLSPWSIDSLDQVIESTGNLTKHSSKLEASKNFGVQNIRHEFKFKGHPSLRVTGDHLGLFHHGEIVLYLCLYFKIDKIAIEIWHVRTCHIWVTSKTCSQGGIWNPTVPNSRRGLICSTTSAKSCSSIPKISRPIGPTHVFHFMKYLDAEDGWAGQQGRSPQQDEGPQYGQNHQNPSKKVSYLAYPETRKL